MKRRNASFVDLHEITSSMTEIHASLFPSTLLCAVNDSRSAENEIIQLMLYREAFLPPGPSAKELYGPLVRKVEALDKKLADAESRTFDDFDDANAR